MISGVGIGRRERFGEVTGVEAIRAQDICFGVAGVAGGVGGFLACSGGVTGLDIENFGVVFGEVVGVVEIEVVSEIVEILSPSLLKLRPEAILSTSFVAWC